MHCGHDLDHELWEGSVDNMYMSCRYSAQRYRCSRFTELEGKKREAMSYTSGGRANNEDVAPLDSVFSFLFCDPFHLDDVELDGLLLEERHVHVFRVVAALHVAPHENIVVLDDAGATETDQSDIVGDCTRLCCVAIIEFGVHKTRCIGTCACCIDPTS